MIQIHVHVIDLLYERERLVCKQVVHIKRMLRQLHAAVIQNARPVNQRVHHKILLRAEPSRFFPAAKLSFGKYVPIADCFGRLLLQMIVHIVADDQIRFVFATAPEPQRRQKPVIRLCVQPVVRIHHFKINAGCQRHPCIDAGAVPAVFFMDHSHNVRILRRVSVRDLARPVGGAVVHQNDLHIVPAFQ